MNEAAVAALDEAAKGPTFDLQLLQVAPVKDITRQVAVTVKTLESMDHSQVLAKQGFFSRMTGADVEARLNFELASQSVLLQISQLRLAASNGKTVRRLLEEARTELIIEQDRLNDLIAEAKAFLAANMNAEAFVVSRFERRLSNIMAIHASNMLTIEQISMARQVLAGALDRVTDVETLLLPLWQRNVLAVAHTTDPREQRIAVSKFAESNNNLISYLKQELS